MSTRHVPSGRSPPTLLCNRVVDLASALSDAKVPTDTNV